jgi:hypothetical protein
MHRANTAIFLAALGLGVASNCGGEASDVPHSRASDGTGWSMLFGDEDEAQEGRYLAVDDHDNVIVSGVFRGTIDFGSGPLSFDGSLTPFVTKLDPSGNAMWSKCWAASGQSEGELRPVVDAEANVYLAGFTAGPIDLGGGVLPANGAEDALVAKFDPSGELVWGRRFGGKGFQRALGQALDPEGNLLVLITSVGEIIDLGGGPAGSPYETTLHILRMSPQGEYLSSREIPYPSAALPSPWLLPPAVDADGNVFLSGRTDPYLDLGCGAPDAGRFDVTKLDAAGGCLWSAKSSGTGDLHVPAVAISTSGGMVVAGHLTGDVSFASASWSATRAGFVVGLDAQGGRVFDVLFNPRGEESNVYPKAVGVDGDGGVYVTGTFQGTVEVGNERINSAEGMRVFAAKFRGGELVWLRSSKGEGAHHSMAVAVGSDMQPVIAGYVAENLGTATIDLGQGLLTARGRGDGFVAKLYP